jgi:Protein of unknown function (DUF3060)
MSRSRRSMARAIGLVAFGGLAASTAYAQGAIVARSGTAFIADCAGGDATVNGSGDSIMFRNPCRTLTVSGSGNTIQIDLASAGTVTLNGNGNRVSYASAGGTQNVAVEDHGQGNAVTRVAALLGGTINPHHLTRGPHT